MSARAFTQSTCDADKSCAGNSLRLNGSDLQYVDVFNTPILQSIDSTNALTVECWLKINRRAGVRQYIAGVWGPRTDRDDKWVMYISELDSLTFTLSNNSTNFSDFDNTSVTFPMSAMYGNWFHLAAEWDGITQQARLYVNARLVASGTNIAYPIFKLRTTQSYLQLGSFNGITNDPASFKTLDGEIDECRMWNIIVPEQALRCNRYNSLNGNEAGLILYFRCNESNGATALCDASRYNWRGAVRGGAQFIPSTRIVPQTTFITPNDFTFHLGCISDTTLQISLTDTSECGSTVFVSLSGPDTAGFQLSTNTITLARNLPQIVNVRTNLRTTGVINASISLIPVNRCSAPKTIPISITRNTQLTVSSPRVVFDTLYGCVGKPSSDKTVQLCNQSTDTLTVSALNVINPEFTSSPIGWNFPLRLLPGECRDVLLNFFPADSGSFRDTLRIVSTDKCPGSGLVPIFGRYVKVLNSTIDSVNFDTPGLRCRRSLNLAQEFFVRNLTNDSLIVEAFETNLPSFSSPTRVPFYMAPNRSYQAYIRFRENVEGLYRDTVRIRMRFKGCTIYKPIIVQGRIIDVKLTPSDTIVNFGTVVVGKLVTRIITLRNDGLDTRQVFIFLQSGRVFSATPPGPYNLAPGQSSNINMTFRPFEARAYRDTLCIQDVGCVMNKCVIIYGLGVNGTLEFDPGYVESKNVINCQCRTDTVRVKNISGNPLTIFNVTLQGPAAGKFSFLPPQPIPNEVLTPEQVRTYFIQFCPNNAPDYQIDFADLVFQTNGADDTLKMFLRGSNIQPKLFIAPVTDYGDVEVGTSFTLPIKIQNVSPVTMRVDSIGNLPQGYSLVNTIPPLPAMLGFRDTLIANVRFSPTMNTRYTGNINVYSNNPCGVSVQGTLNGKGIIVPLFVPWSTIVFREATRCDSVPRLVALMNDGSVPIRIDSIWIIGTDASSFTWKGVTFTGIPRDVPPKTNDTILITYYPIFSQNVLSIAQIRIAATTRLGQQIFTINLSGGRVQQFIPNTNRIIFSPTPVRTAAPNQTLRITNPAYLDTLVIDSLSFEPPSGVYGVIGGLPAVVPPRATVSFQITFRPLAAVDYAAHIRIRNRKPCNEVDTTIAVFGSGYAPPYLVTLCLDTNVVAKIGDLIRLPIYVNRNIPQDPVDISLLLRYYNRALKYEGAEPVFTSRSMTFDTLNTDGLKLTLRGNQNVQRGPIAYVYFRVAAADSIAFFFVTDSIAFTSDSTLFIALLGDGCASPMVINPNCNVTRLSFNTNVYALMQNRPNPFNLTTLIEFEIVEDTRVVLTVFDSYGREVRRLIDGSMTHGRYRQTFDARGLPSGVYYYRLHAGVFSAMRKMILVK